MSAKYWTRVVIGGAIYIVSICLATWGLYRVLRIGTCASGGAYVSARPCPPGTGGAIMGLVGGIFGVLIGTVVLAARDAKRPSQANIGLLAWGLGFLLPCAGIVVSIYGPANEGRSDSKLGGLIVLVVFGLMGIGPLLLSLRNLFRFREPGKGVGALRSAFGSPSIPMPGTPRPVTILAPGPTAATPPKPPAASGAPTAETVEQLEQLADLRRSGALTEAEFQAAKKRILG
jgi:hypothetical protein